MGKIVVIGGGEIERSREFRPTSVLYEKT